MEELSNEPDAKIKKSPICDFILESEDKAKFYTGLDKYHRNIIWDLLGDTKSELTLIGRENVKSGKLRCMTLECQFLLTLMILRMNYTYTDLSYKFKLSETTITSVFKTWLHFIYYKYHDDEVQRQMLVKSCDIPKPLPQAFRNSILKNVRFVIDCTEIIVEGSENFEVRFRKVLN